MQHGKQDVVGLAPSVGTSSALSSTTTTGTNMLAPSPGLAAPAGSTPPKAPIIGSYGPGK